MEVDNEQPIHLLDDTSEDPEGLKMDTEEPTDLLDDSSSESDLFGDPGNIELSVSALCFIMKFRVLQCPPQLTGRLSTAQSALFSSNGVQLKLVFDEAYNGDLEISAPESVTVKPPRQPPSDPDIECIDCIIID